MNIFKQKISPLIAFLFVLVFGYFSISLMNQVFDQYANDELLVRLSQLQSQLSQQK